MAQSFADYVMGKKAYFMVREDMKRAQQICITFKNELSKFTKDILKKSVSSANNFAQKKVSFILPFNCQQSRKDKDQSEKPIDTPDEILAQQLNSNQEYYPAEWDNDKFDHFIMKCSRKD